jgi:hypothetical protein
MSCDDKLALLETVVSLRVGLIAASQSDSIEERITRFCDSLSAWAKIPQAASQFYGRVILDALFALAECIEDDSRLGDMQRLAIELSLWQVACKLGLPEFDHGRAPFITTRQRRLQHALEAKATAPVVKLLFRWFSLLNRRPGKKFVLPGVFESDASAIVAGLMDFGLPRRARAVCLKFQLPFDPIMRWTIEHRPESEEISRTKGLLERLAAPPEPLPYSAMICIPSLQRVLAAPLDALPIVINSNGILIFD